MSVSIRKTISSDAQHLTKWFLEPHILRWFPMYNQREIDDSVRVWMTYMKQNAAFTAEIKGRVCGMTVLYLNHVQKLQHQCLFSIIVDKEFRGKGIGTELIRHLKYVGKHTFGLEILHLEVYKGNPAIHLYEREGFRTYGVHKRFLKEQDGTYLDKIMMQQSL